MICGAEGKGSEFIVDLNFRIAEHEQAAAPVKELEGIRALVADDDMNTCLSVCSMLRNLGLRPDWTSYGKEAVVRAKEAYENEEGFGVYIIDWLIPDQNGIETARRIRAVTGETVPVILLTAYDWTEIEEEAKKAGVTDFVSKPIFYPLPRVPRVTCGSVAGESAIF